VEPSSTGSFTETTRTAAGSRLIIRIASDFARNPGARYRTDGPKSGQEFRDDMLLGAFARARDAGVTLLIDFDGADGYATSFLEETFGGLARKYSADLVLETLRFKSDEEPGLIDEVKQYIREANDPLS